MTSVSLGSLAARAGLGSRGVEVWSPAPVLGAAASFPGAFFIAFLI